MRYKSHVLGSFIFQSWKIDASPATIKFEINNVARTVPLEDIVDITISGIVWKKLTLHFKDKEYDFKGLSNNKANDIKRDIKGLFHTKTLEAISLAPHAFDEALDKSQKLLSVPKYISYYLHNKWRDSLHNAVIRTLHPFFDAAALSDSQNKIYDLVHKFSLADNESIKQHNEAFIKQTQIKCKDLFDNLEAFPLSEEQQRAVIIDADRQLLISAAGSGKSATIVAKAVYLIDQDLATSDEILVLAYNKDAQKEIQERLQSRLGVTPKYTSPVTAKTFHSLGLEILKTHANKKPSIAEIATAGKNRQLQIFNKLIQNLIKQDKAFARDWNLFNLLYLNHLKSISSFTSKSDYDNYLLEAGGYWRGPINNKEIVLLTMDGKEVKSMEELQIANWLVLNGIKYEYERSYELDVADSEHRQYMPDFYYPEADLYHEHFAIDKNGKAPAFFKDYVEGVKWKRKLHATNKTSLIETHSAHFSDGSVLNVLEGALVKHGLKCSSLSSEALDELIGDSFNNDEHEIFLIFLRHFKMNNLTIAQISNKNKPSINYIRNSMFIGVFKPIYNAYKIMLEDNNQIDFEDQIHQAAEILEKGEYLHPYKYILVDEFQDLSQDRKRLILSLLSQNENAHLFGVGDDWQSIYRFSGADIDLMVNFSEHFGRAAITQLTKTYRSYQGIVDTASKFIMKNPDQIKKTVLALNDIDNCQVNIIDYNDEQSSTIEDLLDRFEKISIKNNTPLTVFLLGRYNFLRPENMADLIDKCTHVSLSFKTIHASKGLEADYVIILNLEAGKFGFPSTIDDDPLLELVIPKPEHYPHAEERRLMYVALTRAKRGVFLLRNTRKPSVFSNELLTILKS